MTTITQDELLAQLRARFGDDPLDWAFVCPQCGDVATARDFQEAGLPEGKDASEYLGQQCIGRVLGALRQPAGAWKGRGCDWCAFGLIGGPVGVELPNGKTIRSFEIAPAPPLPERADRNDRRFDELQAAGDVDKAGFEQALLECAALQEEAERLVLEHRWTHGRPIPDGWTARDWSRVVEVADGSDSISTIERGPRTDDGTAFEPSGAFVCCWPGCKFARHDPEALWRHIHNRRAHPWPDEG